MISPFEKAVAGSTPFLFAQDFPGKVFKRVHPCEKKFYELLETRPSSLKKLVPRYYGTLTLKPSEGCKLSDELRDTPSEYLVLEDLTQGFTHPCILDIKLGVTHQDIINTEDNGSPSPPIRKSKYISASALGFCLTGMQVFKVTTGNFEFMDQAEGKRLTEYTISDKLRYFFHNGAHFREDVVALLLQRLRKISTYFENEVDARMIDFAHAKHIPNRKYRDEYGYLFGTKNLTRFLENLLKPPSTL